MKIIATIVLTAFTYTFVLYEPLLGIMQLKDDYSKSKQFKELTENPDEFILPSNLGRIVDKGGSGKEQRRPDVRCLSLPAGSRTLTSDFELRTSDSPLFVFIQDIHCNPEVQKNIYEIIKLFDSKYGISKVFVEGAPEGPVNTTILSSIPDKTLRNKVLTKMFNKGLMTGPEYYSIVEDKNNLYGLEQWDIYLANYARLKNILLNKENWTANCEMLSTRITQIKEKYLSKKLRKLEKTLYPHRQTASNKQQTAIDTLNYFKLEKLCQKLGVGLSFYPQTAKYLQLLKLNKQINYIRLENELKQYNGELQSIVPYKIYNELSDKMKSGKIDDYYLSLASVSNEYTPQLKYKHPNLWKFLEYLRLNRDINPVNLVLEETAIKKNILKLYARKQSDKEILFLCEMCEHLKRFGQLSLTPEEYNYFKSNTDLFKQILQKYFSNTTTVRRSERETGSGKLTFDFGLRTSDAVNPTSNSQLPTSNLSPLTSDLLSLIDNDEIHKFYETNIARNQIFVKAIEAECMGSEEGRGKSEEESQNQRIWKYGNKGEAVQSPKSTKGRRQKGEGCSKTNGTRSPIKPTAEIREYGRSKFRRNDLLVEHQSAVGSLHQNIRTSEHQNAPYINVYIVVTGGFHSNISEAVRGSEEGRGKRKEESQNQKIWKYGNKGRVVQSSKFRVQSSENRWIMTEEKVVPSTFHLPPSTSNQTSNLSSLSSASPAFLTIVPNATKEHNNDLYEKVFSGRLDAVKFVNSSALGGQLTQLAKLDPEIQKTLVLELLQVEIQSNGQVPSGIKEWLGTKGLTTEGIILGQVKIEKGRHIIPIEIGGTEYELVVDKTGKAKIRLKEPQHIIKEQKIEFSEDIEMVHRELIEYLLKNTDLIEISLKNIHSMRINKDDIKEIKIEKVEIENLRSKTLYCVTFAVTKGRNIKEKQIAIKVVEDINNPQTPQNVLKKLLKLLKNYIPKYGGYWSAPETIGKKMSSSWPEPKGGCIGYSIKPIHFGIMTQEFLGDGWKTLSDWRKINLTTDEIKLLEKEAVKQYIQMWKKTGNSIADPTPSNFMLSKNQKGKWQLKIVDFGEIRKNMSFKDIIQQLYVEGKWLRKDATPLWEGTKEVAISEVENLLNDLKSGEIFFSYQEITNEFRSFFEKRESGGQKVAREPVGWLDVAVNTGVISLLGIAAASVVNVLGLSSVLGIVSVSGLFFSCLFVAQRYQDARLIKSEENFTKISNDKWQNKLNKTEKTLNNLLTEFGITEQIELVPKQLNDTIKSQSMLSLIFGRSPPTLGDYSPPTDIQPQHKIAVLPALLNPQNRSMLIQVLRHELTHAKSQNELRAVINETNLIRTILRVPSLFLQQQITKSYQLLTYKLSLLLQKHNIAQHENKSFENDVESKIADFDVEKMLEYGFSFEMILEKWAQEYLQFSTFDFNGTIVYQIEQFIGEDPEKIKDVLRQTFILDRRIGSIAFH